ncbi:4'-phosphopantetheinyl transferase superfamily protein [Oceanobacillus alkalisoli]|uniref:4'-phosphopantetheinyl transferase superfamily protein n=1 Tax=Oceanobacillus alkalisoli TaxID=2925113 RepID=UPI001F11B962|nr:4'-phosphopantetheinyl transferase superfamily protein [Oceanobacillus alkalisoli]MCF3941533.1 4'-phosphopantetheinyl transferase superfamily protein [Oceanobacillus alkalisoli]
MMEYYGNGIETFKTFVKFSDVSSIHIENATRLFNQREWSDLNIYRTKRRIEASKSLYLAKESIMEFLGFGIREIRNISLLKGVFGQPVIVNNNNSSINIGISITHTEKTIGVLLFDQRHPMGIDVENKTSTDSEFLEPYFTDFEKRMIKNSGGTLSKEILFSAKESLSKILKTGLTSPLQIYEISKYYKQGDTIYLFYKNFVQYKTTVQQYG